MFHTKSHSSVMTSTDAFPYGRVSSPVEQNPRSGRGANRGPKWANIPCVGRRVLLGFFGARDLGTFVV